MEFYAAVLMALVIIASPASAQKSPPAPATIALPPSPAPAPAPAPPHVNLTQLLTVAGPFSIFLSYLEKTDVIETFQNQINSSYDGHADGITVFVPKNSAFTSLKNTTFSNLTADELKTLCLYHALNKYYSLSEFGKLSALNPVSTLAGGQYTLNLTDDMGNISVTSMWSTPRISSSVFSTRPVALYQLNKVLLPLQLFTKDPPLAPAPAPAPESKLPADTAPAAGAKGKGGASSNESAKGASFRAGVTALNYLAMAAAGAWLALSW